MLARRVANKLLCNALRDNLKSRGARRTQRLYDKAGLGLAWVALGGVWGLGRLGALSLQGQLETLLGTCWRSRRSIPQYGFVQYPNRLPRSQFEGACRFGISEYIGASLLSFFRGKRL